MFSSNGIRKAVKSKLSDLNRSYYYGYAQRNIGCDCPLCFCPARNANRYSFVFICEWRSLIYFNVPKAASTFIRKAVFQDDLSLSLRDPGKRIQDYFKFTFVRNPWDRIVSNWKMFTTQPFRIQQLKSMTTEDVTKFEKFVHFANNVRNHHWQPQVLFVPKKVDFIGRVESFEKDLNELYSQIGMVAPVNCKKENCSEHLPYWEYYTPSLVEVVSEMYREDIVRFGYSFCEDGSFGCYKS